MNTFYTNVNNIIKGQLLKHILMLILEYGVLGIFYVSTSVLLRLSFFKIFLNINIIRFFLFFILFFILKCGRIRGYYLLAIGKNHVLSYNFKDRRIISLSFYLFLLSFILFFPLPGILLYFYGICGIMYSVSGKSFFQWFLKKEKKSIRFIPIFFHYHLLLLPFMSLSFIFIFYIFIKNDPGPTGGLSHFIGAFGALFIGFIFYSLFILPKFFIALALYVNQWTEAKSINLK